MQRIQGVHADTALKARARQLSEPALHLVLQNEVLGALGNMLEPVNALADQR